MDADTPCRLRVVTGTPSAEELAAVVIALLARAARPGDEAAGGQRPGAPWHRLERAAGFDSPRAWQSPRTASR